MHNLFVLLYISEQCPVKVCVVMLCSSDDEEAVSNQKSPLSDTSARVIELCNPVSVNVAPTACKKNWILACAKEWHKWPELWGLFFCTKIDICNRHVTGCTYDIPSVYTKSLTFHDLLHNLSHNVHFKTDAAALSFDFLSSWWRRFSVVSFPRIVMISATDGPSYKALNEKL